MNLWGISLCFTRICCRLEADEKNMPVVSEGYPKEIASEWPGVENGVDAAFTDYSREKTFFFKGDIVYW